MWIRWAFQHFLKLAAANAFVICFFSAGKCAAQETLIAKNSKLPESHRRSGVGGAHEVSMTAEYSESQIKVTTYNVHFLPTLAVPFAGRRGQHEYRAAEIGRQLQGSDIIGFCEAFHKKQSDLLVKGLQETESQELHVARGPSRSGRHLTNSGLMLVSRFPIVQSNNHTFKNATRLIKHGFKNDGLAAKGVLHVRVDRESGQQLDCFLTHLESQNEKVRMAQVTELVDFIKMHRDENLPAIVMGDFNIASSKASEAEASLEYLRLVEMFNSGDAKFEDLGQGQERASGTSDAMAEGGGKRIDYIFWSNTSDCNTFLKHYQFAHAPLRDSKVSEGSLSDHCAVSCNLKIRSKLHAKQHDP
ncbi:MAG: sphingomyelin phosphodiesterase [Planctomycetota bacterium]